jgi:hypothetical protein
MIEGTRRGRRWAASARAAALAAALSGMVLLTACGGGGSATAAGSAGPGAPHYQKLFQQALAYAQCMRSHGAPSWPDPDSHGYFTMTPANSADFRAPASARQTCQHLLPKGKALTPAQQASASRANLALAACMRRHGYPNFPDSWGGGIHVGQFTSLGIDVNSPRFQAAMKSCGWH